MPVPAQRPSTSLTAQIPDGFSRSEGRQLARLQNAELTHGLVAATRIQARGFVTSVGIQAIGMLSREAEFQAAGDPQVSARVNLLVDQFTMAIASEIGRM
jgi:hypothetical protein